MQAGFQCIRSRMHMCRESNKNGETHVQQLTVASLSVKSQTLTQKREHSLSEVDSEITANRQLAGQAEMQYQ